MERPAARLELEQLEDRIAPAAIMVTVTTDKVTDGKAEAGSLRAAIDAVNDGKADKIDFKVNTVNVATIPLPTIVKPVTIEGNTAPGGNVEIKPDKATKQVQLLLSGLTFGAGSDGSQILGVTIDGFSGGGGIALNNVSNVLIGEKRSSEAPPTFAPVVLYSDQYGLYITGNKATGNAIYDSFLGTDANSTAGKGNASAGVYLSNQASNNSIGGTGENERNIISGNVGTKEVPGYGVLISSTARVL